METKTPMRIQHLFNCHKKRKGPLLVIERCDSVSTGVNEVIIAHRWFGSGTASEREFSQLTDFYDRRKGLEFVAHYIRGVVL